jgi:hypothetical protein
MADESLRSELVAMREEDLRAEQCRELEKNYTWWESWFAGKGWR